MTLKALLAASKQYLDKYPGYANGYSFATGAEWMLQHLQKMDGKPPDHLQQAGRFNLYGICKYGLSLMALIISALLFYQYCVWLLPWSAVVFYLVEVQFLFLFPLLIDGVANPVLNSFRATNKVGMLGALFITMSIGIFMMAGLLRFKDPLHNWHLGCIAVLIWYRDEVRGRV